jgi:hypothetical protein
LKQRLFQSLFSFDDSPRRHRFRRQVRRSFFPLTLSRPILGADETRSMVSTVSVGPKIKRTEYAEPGRDARALRTGYRRTMAVALKSINRRGANEISQGKASISCISLS